MEFGPRFLIDSIFTNKSLKRCATHYSSSKMAEYLVNAYPNSVVYYPIPEKDSESWQVDWLLEHDRIVYIEQPQYRDRYKEYFTLKPEWLEAFCFWGEYFDWDIMITPRATMVPYIRVIAEKNFQNPMKKIIVFDPLPMLDFKTTVLINKMLRMQTLSGYLNSDIVAVHTGHEYKGVMEDCRELISFSSIKAMKEKLRVKYIAPVMNHDFPNKKEEFFLNDEKLRVLYTQRLDKNERRPDMVFDTFMYSFVTEDKDKIDFRVCTNSRVSEVEEVMKGKNDYSFFPMCSPERNEFYQYLESAHVFVSFAIEEGLPLSLFEAVTYGVIGVVNRRPWSVDMFGEDYPFLCSNIEDATALIKFILHNREKAYTMFLKWYNEWFIPTHENRGNFLDDIKENIDRWHEETAKRILKTEESEVSLQYVMNDNVKKYYDGSEDYIDLYDYGEKLYKDKLMRNNLNEKVNMYNIPLSRTRSIYTSVLALKYRYGWKDYPRPRSYKCEK